MIKSHSGKIKTAVQLVLGAAMICTAMRATCADESPAKPPGVVIDYSPASSGRYIGSPSISILADGTHLASHDFFGPKSNARDCATTVVFRSNDRGATWKKVAELECLFWANLFTNRDSVYLIGTDKEYGQIVIRRSTDGGQTWTAANDSHSGRLTPEGQWHTAPMPVVYQNGRLWRAFENADGGTEWGKRFKAGMLSAPEGADLLKASSWTFSNFLPRNADWLEGRFRGWLEGNAVLTPEGQIVDILRVDTVGLPEKAAMVQISPDGRTASFSEKEGFFDLPGGAKKFSIRRDPLDGAYWTLASIVTNRDDLTNSPALRPADVRNTLALLRSKDLKHWEIRAVILHHPEVRFHGFQYADWQFDGPDIAAVVRTAYDDAQTGAHNKHDANFLTFNRISAFRDLKSH